MNSNNFEINNSIPCPCRECQTRTAVCHATCGRYAEYNAAMEIQRKTRNATAYYQKSIDEASWSPKWKRPH